MAQHDVAHTQLAEATLVSGRSHDGIPHHGTENTTGRSMGGAAHVEPSMAPAASRGQDVMGEPSAALDSSLRLLDSHGWSSRTRRTRDSQWRVWLAFCEADERPPMPVTEAHFVAFFGCIRDERRAGRRRITSSSIPQYFSTVRQRQLATMGTSVPEFPFVAHVRRAFSGWEEEEFPNPDVRMGISAAEARKIWDLGMNSENNGVIRDAAMCIFAFSFNGLRESSVASVLTANIELTNETMTARLSVVKGRRASREQLVRFTRDHATSPLDLWIHFSSVRRNHPRYFGIPGESVAWQPQALTAALDRCLRA